MASNEEPRARLEAQAAAILGKARADAAELVRRAKAEADDVRGQVNRYAADRVRDADALRDQALGQMVSVEASAAGQVIDASDPWVVHLTGETLDDMVAGAVRAAVRRAVHPVVIRAGRYTIAQPSQRQ